MTPPKWKRLIAPGIAAFITFWLLIALGVWQLHRLKWKEGILAAIHTAEISAPIPLPDHPTPFEKVSIAGAWVPGKAVLYGDEVHDSPTGPIAGGEIIMPFARPNGQIVLVDLGWVPQQIPTPYPEPAGPTQVAGYLHSSITPGWFAAPDSPGQGLYYTFNAAKIAAGMGLKNVNPKILIAICSPRACAPPGGIIAAASHPSMAAASSSVAMRANACSRRAMGVMGPAAFSGRRRRIRTPERPRSRTR